ncbi:MAG: hypothetical protein ACRDYC_09675, partial [Acidimicrobiales bacterium]
MGGGRLGTLGRAHERAWWRTALACVFGGLFVGGFLPLLGPGAAAASGADLYAAATGGTGTACTMAVSCTLATALSVAGAGDDILLTTQGSTAHYVGNWTVSTPGTTPATPLTIEPEPGVANPILDGNKGSSTRCTTNSCNGSILALSAGVSLSVENLTIEDADATARVGDDGGGGIDTGDSFVGGTVVVTGVTFSSNTAANGGAIDNGDKVGGRGTVSVSNSTFSSNNALYDGGAIDNGDVGGGTLMVSNSTFSSNSA